MARKDIPDPARGKFQLLRMRKRWERVGLDKGEGKREGRIPLKGPGKTSTSCLLSRMGDAEGRRVNMEEGRREMG